MIIAWCMLYYINCAKVYTSFCYIIGTSKECYAGILVNAESSSVFRLLFSCQMRQTKCWAGKTHGEMEHCAPRGTVAAPCCA